MAALLLRDLFLLSEEDLGGGVGSGLSFVIFLAFLPILSPSDTDSTLDEDSEFWLSLTTGSFGSADLVVAGWGIVCERFEVGVTTLFVTLGEADDHEMGVVVFVDALHGLDDVVNCVEGLLMLLIDDDAGLMTGILLATNACNSGISRGGSSVGGYVADFSRYRLLLPFSSYISAGDNVWMPWTCSPSEFRGTREISRRGMLDVDTDMACNGGDLPAKVGIGLVDAM